MAELSVVFEKKGSYSYKPDMFYVCFDKLYRWRVQTKYFFKFEKLHVVLRLSLIYIPLSKSLISVLLCTYLLHVDFLF